MRTKPDFLKKHYAPLKAKTLQHAIAYLIGQEFPRIGGERIRQLCATMVVEVVDIHKRPREHVCHGQVLWLAISVDDPPRRHQRTETTKMVPVLLDLVTDEDIDARLERKMADERLVMKAIRLCRQAYQQGGLLANTDLAALLNTADSRIASLLSHYEGTTGTVIPRRATIHDVGTGMTHKRIICFKRYREGKSSDVIARETYHSIEAVDHYLGQFDRVRCCRNNDMTPEQTAHILTCSLSLVHEYLDIDRDLRKE
jgi:hypothetical protein